MTELCQFLGEGWKVIIAVKQHYKPLLTVRNRGGELILSKKTPQLKWRGPKKAKKQFFNNLKICDCGSNSARELKKEENVQTQSKNKIK